MSRVPSVPRCSTRSTGCRRTSSATASAIRSKPELAAALAAGLLIAAAASAAQPPARETQPPARETQTPARETRSPAAKTQPPAREAPLSLVEAARRNRARIEALRERDEAAPVFTDSELRPGGRAATAPPPDAPDRNPEGYDLPIREPAPDPDRVIDPTEGEGDADPEAVRARAADRLRGIAARETEIRERLLDIEASLAAIGASGLPAAPRNPTRFQSPLDASRLRSEQEDLRQELDALAVERRILR